LQDGGAFTSWFEHLEGSADVLETTSQGQPAIFAAGGLHYSAGWPDTEAMDRILRAHLAKAGLSVREMPDGLRLRETPTHRVWINYSEEDRTVGT